MRIRRAIVDECGSIVFWCDELEDGDTEEILELHPEWTTRCFEVHPEWANRCFEV